jgi:hypothetical protein
MGRVCVQAELADVHVEAIPIVVRDAAALDNAFGLRDWARFAYEQRLVGAGEVSAWQEALDAAIASGCFVYAFMLFITAGHKRPGAV